MAEPKRVCIACLREEPFLSHLTENEPDVSERCNYCDSSEKTLSLTTLANHVDRLIENYYREGEYNLLKDEFEGEPLYSVLEEEVSDNEALIKDLSDELYALWNDDIYMTKYDDDPYFVQDIKVPDELRTKWYKMERELRESNRFFNIEALQTFKEVFGYLHKNHPSAFIEFETSRSLYRGRIFQSDKSLEAALRMPESSFGPPPAELAPSGRMNARGISVFYGATVSDNAISEVRPPVGSYVAVAEFKLLRPVRLLDLSILSGLAVKGFSLFDPEHLLRYEITNFLQSLSKKLVMPVVPELEDANYLLTQAIADYLSVTDEYQLDGILFRSAQKSKESINPDVKNIILFHKSSGVLNSTARENPAYVNLYEQDEEGHHFTPEISTTKDDFRKVQRDERREDILQINLDSIEIHKIEGVEYFTKKTPVYHYLDEDSENKKFRMRNLQ